MFCSIEKKEEKKKKIKLENRHLIGFVSKFKWKTKRLDDEDGGDESFEIR